MKVEQANYIKAIFTAVFAFLSALLGVLAVPVILLVACNLIDYATGLMASKYRAQDINSIHCHNTFSFQIKRGRVFAL